MIDGEADGDTFGKLCSSPIGRRLRRLRLGQFDRQICRCRLLRHRILAFADCRPHILPARAFFKQKMPTKRKTIGYALLSGVFLAFDLALWHESIHAVGPGISTLLNSLQIFFLAAIGFFFYSERLSTLQILSLILATIGVALIGSPEFGHNDNAAWGFVSGVVSGAMLALSMVFVRKTHEQEKVGLFPLTMILIFGGAIALVIPSLLFDNAHLYPKTLNDAILVSIYGIVMQCFAWALIAYAIPLLSLSLTGLLLLSEPVAAMLIDYFWLDKPINIVQWGGATLTLLAIYLGSLKDKK